MSDHPLIDCEICWKTAERMSRMPGQTRSRTEIYQKLMKSRPSDGTHNPTDKPS